MSEEPSRNAAHVSLLALGVYTVQAIDVLRISISGGNELAQKVVRGLGSTSCEVDKFQPCGAKERLHFVSGEFDRPRRVPLSKLYQTTVSRIIRDDN